MLIYGIKKLKLAWYIAGNLNIGILLFAIKKIQSVVEKKIQPEVEASSYKQLDNGSGIM